MKLFQMGVDIKSVVAAARRFITKNMQKLQKCGSEAEMREVAAKICKEYLHGAWKTVDSKELTFRRVSGGLSNFLYYVALPERRIRNDSGHSDVTAGSVRRRSCSLTIDEPKKVLLRIYGQSHGERALDAIVTESVIFTLLSERKLGPKLHGVFPGGRIEGYVPARPVTIRELSEPSLSMKIAEKMAAIHAMDVPLKKEPNWLWKTCYNWLKTLHEALDNPQLKNDREKQVVDKIKTFNFDKELEWLKKYLSTIDSPVVFCHNDLQRGNILLMDEDSNTSSSDEMDILYTDETSNGETVKSNKENNHTMAKNPYIESLRYCEENTNDSVTSRLSEDGEPKIVIIDYEYSAYNYRGFDIANHLHEWMYDYTHDEPPYFTENIENLPTLEQKEIFIKQYLKCYNQFCSEEPNKFEHDPSIEEINDLLQEIEAFSLANDLMWALWGGVNAGSSEITFGYWEYCLSRIEMYLRLKQELIKKLPQKRKICEVDI